MKKNVIVKYDFLFEGMLNSNFFTGSCSTSLESPDSCFCYRTPPGAKPARVQDRQQYLAKSVKKHRIIESHIQVELYFIEFNKKNYRNR